MPLGKLGKLQTFNHVNLAMPTTPDDVGGAGRIPSIGNPMRQMQLGLHFRF